MESLDLAATALTGIGGVGGGCGVAWLLLKAWISGRERKVEQLETKVETLKTTEIQGLKTRVHEVEQRCLQHREDKTVAVLGNKSETVEKQLNRIECKIDGFTAEVARVQEKAEHTESGVKELWSEVNKVKDRLKG